MNSELTKELIRRYLLHYGISGTLAMVFQEILEYDKCTEEVLGALTTSQLWDRVQNLMDVTYID